MNTSLNYIDALNYFQLANKLEKSFTSNNELLYLKWCSLVQLHGGVRPCVELLRHRQLYRNE